MNGLMKDARNGVVIEVACWTHCRRYFYDARTSDALRSHTLLAWIQELYEVEREANELSPERRRKLRQEKAKPLLDAMKTWLDAEQPRVLPKSHIGEAVQYALNNWTALTRYLNDGDLAIDNNVAETALRRIAVGRKNYLFMGNDRGGRAAAIPYTLIGSGKRHALDPFRYLPDLFLRIPTHPNKDLHRLLPDSGNETSSRPSRPHPGCNPPSLQPQAPRGSQDVYSISTGAGASRIECVFLSTSLPASGSSPCVRSLLRPYSALTDACAECQ